MSLIRSIVVSASLLALVNSTSFASSIDVREEAPKQTIMIPVQDRSDEIVKLLQGEEDFFKREKAAFVDKLAPTNPWRTALNTLAYDPTVMLDGQPYQIFGDHESFKANLPSNYAVISNTVKGLTRKDLDLSKTVGGYNIIVSYSCPSSVVKKKKEDTIFQITRQTTYQESVALNFFQQRIEGAEKLRARIESNRSDLVKLPVLAQDASEDLVNTMAAINGYVQKYDALLALREGFSYFKYGMNDGERKYSAFVKNVVQFRLFLQDKADKAVTIDDKGRLVEFSREFLSSANTLHSSLMQFIPWAQGVEIENKALSVFFNKWLEDTPPLN